MVLYHNITLRDFVAGLEHTSEMNPFFSLPAVELMHQEGREDIDYALSLVREAIVLYEEREGIPQERSKRAIPFFRQGSRMLIGPEIGLHILTLSESALADSLKEEPMLCLELDYQQLGMLCLLEDYSLVSCKRDRDAMTARFMEQLSNEYDTFFFDAEHTGFTANSRFFSLLQEACLEVLSGREDTKMWRLVARIAPEEASYRYDRGDLVPYLPIRLPVACLNRIHLMGQADQPLLFGTLNGFLKSKKLPAERLLDLV